MKVLYLTAGIFDKGGVSRYNRYQIRALQAILGEDKVNIVSLAGPADDDRDFETQFDVDWHGKSSRPRLRDMVAFTLVVFRFSLAFRPDVIWSAHLYFSAIAYLFAKLLGAVSITQVYGREAWTPRPFRLDIFWGLRRCQYIVSDSHFTADYLETHHLTQKSVQVIWDPVDINHFRPASNSSDVLRHFGIQLNGDEFIILTLGRLTQVTNYKGYERLLEIFVGLPQQAVLIFGGGGDLIPILRERAKELNVIERVYFTGYIDERDLVNVYRSASVFCLIGDKGLGRGEGVPLTPLEAAACGIPVIVGNQDGSKEAVNHGVTGFALDPFDHDSITKHLVAIISDEDYRRQLGRNARYRSVKEFSFEVFKERTKSFLSSIHLKDRQLIKEDI